MWEGSLYVMDVLGCNLVFEGSNPKEQNGFHMNVGWIKSLWRSSSQPVRISVFCRKSSFLPLRKPTLTYPDPCCAVQVLLCAAAFAAWSVLLAGGAWWGRAALLYDILWDCWCPVLRRLRWCTCLTWQLQAYHCRRARCVSSLCFWSQGKEGSDLSPW